MRETVADRSHAEAELHGLGGAETLGTRLIQLARLAAAVHLGAAAMPTGELDGPAGVRRAGEASGLGSRPRGAEVGR